MRKLMKSKKGFTLVELMIVVVIMGILTAIAIPVYSTVSKNAERKSCQTNQTIIKENLSTYQMTGGANGGQVAWADMTTVASNDAFKKMFEGGQLPTCPGDGSPYDIKVDNKDGVINYNVKCTGANEADHNPPKGE